MLHLLKIEWLKLKNYRTFWILLLLYIVAIIGANIIAYHINNEIRNSTSNVGKFIPSLYSFPRTWNMITYVSSFLFLFPGLLIINHCCNEFSYKTSRQNIIDGISRKDYISVKLVLALILAFIATVVVFITGMIMGFIATGNTLENFTTNIQYVFYFFLQTVVYCVVAVFIAHWVRRAGLAIGIYFAYSLILENVVASLMFWWLSKSSNGQYSQVLPLQSSDSLIKAPEIGSLMQLNSFSDTVLIFISLGYVILFCWLTYRRFLQRDI